MYSHLSESMDPWDIKTCYCSRPLYREVKYSHTACAILPHILKQPLIVSATQHNINAVYKGAKLYS